MATTDAARQQVKGEEHPLLFDYAGAERYTGLPKRTLRHLWEQRQIRAVKVGTRVYFRRADLDSFVNGQ